MRTEKDSLGKKQLPSTAHYGIHTARSLENFNAASHPLPLEIIYAIVNLKRACAKANYKLKSLEKKKANAILVATKNILLGKHDKEFQIDVFQAGSGTSTHMNVNEVIANLAKLHPNDDVNKGQSTNNIIPSAIRIASHKELQSLTESLENLRKALEQKAKAFSTIPKSARTHLQDAVPITLGQEFRAYAAAIEKATLRLTIAAESLLELGVGGNAVGTGVNTKKAFRKTIISELNKELKTTFLPAVNNIEATQFLTDIAEVSAMSKLAATDLLKITNDLRLLSSGPNTGFGEINLPAVEPGSSIMPGKINPSICEAANMACIQVMGYDHAITIANSLGQLELNTHMPLVANNIIHMIQILKRTSNMLTTKCIRGITANKQTCQTNLEHSAGLATILNPKLGYDRVAELVKESLKTKKTLKQLVLEKKILTSKQFENLVKNSTKPNL
ncbi:MAG: aspartate ammonia-lyase [Nanoarchaeota archaeon]|nr:aspartate ammonia-lyase [Nanoarchaeota archaeon]